MSLIIHQFDNDREQDDPPAWTFGEFVACGFLACMIAAIVILAVVPEGR